MITRDLKLTVGYKSAVLDQPLHLYMYDRNILLNIEIKDYDFRFGGSTDGNFMTDNKNIVSAKSYLKTPSGTVIPYPYVDTKIENNIVKIQITEMSTSTEAEVGEHQIQIVLYDKDGSCLHLHPFRFYVHSLIALTGNKDFDFGDGNTPYVPNYNPNLITSMLLNSLEHRLQYIYSGDLFNNTIFNDINTNSKNIVGSINELKSLHDYISNYIDEQSISTLSIDDTPVPFITRYSDLDTEEKSEDSDTTISLIEISNKFHDRINPGENYKFRVRTIPYRIKKLWVRWKSSDPKVAKVNALGVVTGFRKGKATITAYSKFNPNIRDSFEVEVCEYKPASSISFDNIHVTIGSLTLLEDRIKKLPYDASSIGKDIEVSIEDESIVTYMNGFLKANKEGKTTITVNLKRKPYQKIKREIIVDPHISLEISDYEFQLYQGDVLPIFYKLSIPKATIKWEVSPSDIASVTDNTLYINKVGTFTLKGIAKNGTETIEVSKDFTALAYKLNPPMSFELDPYTQIVNNTFCYIGVTNFVHPAGNIDQRVLWYSDNENIATVRNYNYTYGIVEAKRNGTVNITAKSVRNPDIYETGKVTFQDIQPTNIGIINSEQFAELRMTSDKYPLQYIAEVEFLPSNCSKELEWYMDPANKAQVTDYKVNERGIGRLTLRITDTGSFKLFINSAANKQVGTVLRVNTIIPILDIDFVGYSEGEEIEITDWNPIQLTPTIYPSNATNQNLIWKSSDPSIATVDQNGLVTRVDCGKVKISCVAEEDENIGASVNLVYYDHFKLKVINSSGINSISIRVNDKLETFYPESKEYFNSKNINVYNCLIPAKVRELDLSGVRLNLFEVEELDLSNGYCENIFSYCTSLRKVSFRNTKNFSGCATGMFRGCSSLEEVTGMQNVYIGNADYMFADTVLPDNFDWLKGSTITSAKYMFSGSLIKKAPELNMTSMTDMSYMFYGCRSLTDVYTNLGKVVFSSYVKSTKSMFEGCSSLVTGPFFEVYSLEDATTMFKNCPELRYFELIVDNAYNTTSMFENCSKLNNEAALSLSFGYESKAHNMFKNCTSLTSVNYRTNYINEALRVNASKLLDATSMFEGCTSLNRVPDLNLAEARVLDSMFKNCTSLTDIGELNLPMASLLDHMFEGCTSLVSVNKDMKITYASSLHCMFKNCTSLKNISNIVVHSMDQYSLDLSYMFYNCSSLLNGPGCNNTRIYNTSYMFYRCENLTSTSKLAVRYAKNLSYMFYWCASLTNVPTFSANPREATDMSYMFFQCENMIDDVDPAVYWENEYLKNTNVNSKDCFFACYNLPAYKNRIIPKSWGGY